MIVLVIGAGAVGSFLGGTLAAAGHDVTMLDRFRQLGPGRISLTITGPADNDRRSAEVGTAMREDDAPASPNLLLFAVKMPDLGGAIETARRWPGAVAMAVENGVGADEQVAAGRPEGGLIAGSLTASVALEPGGVRRLSRGGIGLAPVRGDVEAVVASIASSFTAGGLRGRVLPAAEPMRWSKLLANLVGNATSAILDCDVAEVYADPRLFDVERRQVREALAVMRLRGLRPVRLPGVPAPLLATAYRLPPSVGRRILATFVARGRGGKSPSLRLHLAGGGGPSEVGWLNGAVARGAAELGRRAPVNARLAYLVEECAGSAERRDWYRGRPDRLLTAVAT